MADDPQAAPEAAAGNYMWGFQHIIDIVGRNPAPGMMTVALEEICQTLTMSSDEALDSFPIGFAAEFLVRIVDSEGTSEEILLAARGISYLCDSIPLSTDTVVLRGAIPALCARLRAVDYLDVAEECILALEKISRERAIDCLKQGAVMPILGIIDFFTVNVQRTALLMVEKVCNNCTLDDALYIMDAVPILCTMLSHQDQKMAETAAHSLIGLVRSLRSSSMLLEMLCEQGLIDSTLNIIALDGPSTLNLDCLIGLIGLLATAASRSLLVHRTLFHWNIGSILTNFLSRHHSESSYDQVHAFLVLICELIPSFPNDIQDIPLLFDKVKILKDESMSFLQLCKDVLPVLVQMVDSGAQTKLCYGCAIIVNNITYFLTSETLLDLMNELDISRFLSRLLNCKNRHILVPTLNIVESLMEKLPQYLNSFFKEGIVHAIDALVVECSKHPAEKSNSSKQHTLVGSTARDASNCLCYAFTPKFSSTTSETRSCRFFKHILDNLLKRIKATYFTEVMISKVDFSKTLGKIKVLCTELKNGVDWSLTNGCNSISEAELSHTLEKIMQMLEEDSMSAHFFIKSGALNALVYYLSNGGLPHGNGIRPSAKDHICILQKRLYIFACTSFLAMDQSGKNLFMLLIRKVQDALSSLDLFPVIQSIAYEPSQTITDIPAGHSTYNPCLKVRFLTEDQIEMHGREDILTVELSSSFEDIEQVLLMKVLNTQKQLHSTSEGSREVQRRSGTRVLSTIAKQWIAKTISKFPLTCIEHNDSRISDEYQSTENTDSKLIFFMDGKQLDRSLTLYQTILQQMINGRPSFVVGPEFWNEVYEVTYARAEVPKSSDYSNLSLKCKRTCLCRRKPILDWQIILHSTSSMLAELPHENEETRSLSEIFFMLKVMKSLDQCSYQILHSERKKAFAEGKIEYLDSLKVLTSSLTQHFINTRLTDKLKQQMQDFLAINAGVMPSWCAKLMASVPFLISFESRCQYLHLSVFHSRGQENEMQPSKIKFKAYRNNILTSAKEMMTMYSSAKEVIEVEYDGEIGSGLGPTIEFYTLVSQEFQKLGMGMWRGDHLTFDTYHVDRSKKSGHTGFVAAPAGLFPLPSTMKTKSENRGKFSEVIEAFTLLGQLMARAIKDKKILDLPLSRAFYKIILDQELDIYDIRSFDPELGRALMDFEALIERKQFHESRGQPNLTEASDLFYRNTRIEDLCLDFTLPGYPDYVLSSKRNLVNVNNLEEYVSLVIDATVKSGISMQIDALKSGFNEVFSLKALQIFNEEELERLLCGESSNWNSDDLQKCIEFNHGYTSESSQAINLVEIMKEFEHDERKAFLQFSTGSPRLPHGGLAALNPKLTVVKKICTNNADMELPSVMTCTNYLKVPPYSSKEIMRKRILYAISEGQGAFHLS